ncbi:DUF2892 domain-containing protein [Halobaculum sp. MBLA0143]|uniref:YgaP family membrane protein n=1 Tax=Halobaculum sp. MBLA0143 TaxID=3079933 RepID=UPI0035243E8A
MQQNVGETDGLARVLVGAVAGAVSLATLVGTTGLPALVAPVAGLAAAIMLFTGLTSSCPAYSLLGVNTLRR